MKFIAWLVVGATLCGCSEADPTPGAGGNDATGGGGAGGSGAGPTAVWPLSGVAPELPTDDLDPVAALVGDASVIGIGESIHTTGGELRMRARLIRYLVEQEGVRVIALENGWDETEQYIAPFVNSCVGSANDAAMAINPVWWDVSTPALWQWLCEFNQVHPSDPVHVVGVDIRQAWYDFPAIEGFLQQVDPDEAEVFTMGLSTCLGVGFTDINDFFNDPVVRTYFSGTPTPEGDHQACLAGAEALLALLASNEAAFTASSSERELERARLRVVSMRAFNLSIYHLSRGALALANPPRDAAMADVFMTFRRLDFPDARAVVWAHDGHVLRRSEDVLAGQWAGVKNLGTLIGEQLEADYVAIGQLSQATHYDWENGPQTLLHQDANDLEFVLGSLGHDYAVVSTAAAVALPTPVWNAGQAYDMSFDQLVPEHHYDILVFHRDSPANEYFTTPPW